MVVLLNIVEVSTIRAASQVPIILFYKEGEPRKFVGLTTKMHLMAQTIDVVGMG